MRRSETMTRMCAQPSKLGLPPRQGAQLSGTIPVMRLDAAWQRALELAWASFLARTTPVGAVVASPSGRARGRGPGQTL